MRETTAVAALACLLAMACTSTSEGSSDGPSTAADVAPDSPPDAGFSDVGSMDDAASASCREVCDRVYDQCGLFLVYYTGDKVPKSGCRNACEWGYFVGENRCIMQNQCTDEALNECIAVEPSTEDLSRLDPADDWPESWRKFERQVFALVNLHRRRGVECGGTSYEPTEPLARNDHLAEAARTHALDMARNDFYGHTGSDDSTPSRRIGRTDYGPPSTSGEAINRVFADPFSAVKSWLESPRHCRRMISSSHGYEATGIGYVRAPSHDAGHLWTLDYAARR